MLSVDGPTCRARSGRWPGTTLALLLILSFWPTASRAFAAEQLSRPTASKSAREEAMRALPLNALRPDAAKEIRDIVSQAAMYRRLPVTSARCDKDLFIFWIRNPDVIVGIWEQMGVTEISMQRTGDFTFQASDGAGTSSALELVYGTPELHIYKGVGYYEGSLIKRPIRGDCVVLLRNRYRPDSAGGTEVVSQMDVFVALEQSAVELAAKTLQPLFVRYADLNFVETIHFVERLSEAAIKQGDRMSSLAHRLEKVTPAVQFEFSRLASKAARGH